MTEHRAGLVSSPGTMDDVDAVCLIGQRAIDGHAPPSRLKARMSLQDDVLHVVRTTAGGRIVGYLITYWLTAGAIESIQAGDITCGADIAPHHLARSPLSATGVYVAMIWRSTEGPEVAKRGEVVRRILADLDAAVARHVAVESIAARAATHDGQRFLRRLGLSPLAGQPAGGLWGSPWPPR